MNVEELNKAKIQYTQYCKRDKKNPDAWMSLARINKELGFLEEAKLNCIKVLKLRPRHFNAIELLGGVYQALGDNAKAEKNFNKLIEFKPKEARSYNAMAMFMHSNGQLNFAEKFYQQSLALDSKQHFIFFNMASVKQELGDLGAAIDYYQQAINLKPDYAKAFSNLAYIYRLNGELEKSYGFYQKALGFISDIPDIHYNLGLVQRELNLTVDAKLSLNKAIELNPGYADAYIALAEMNFSAGDISAALSVCYSALRMLPNDHDVLSYTGYLNSESGDANSAIINLKKAVKSGPANIRSLHLLSSVFFTNDKPDKALKYARDALKLSPNDSDVNHLLGNIYKRSGDYDKALTCFQTAHEADHSNYSIVADIADIFEIRGEYDEALAFIKPFILKSDVTQNILTVYSSLSAHYKNENHAIELMLNYVDNNELENSIDVHKELGKKYDKASHYDLAFKHYHEFNEGMRLDNKEWVSKYSVDNDLNEVDECVVNYKKDFWNSINSSGNQTERPVFVIGMPRSGTSLTEQILSTHPDVFGAGELTDIPKIVEDLMKHKQRHPEFLRNMTETRLSEAADKYLLALNEHSETAQRVIDKMPTNFWYVGLISSLFPKAKIIHIQRHPMDTCLSIYFQKFGASMPFTTKLVDIGKHYNAYSKLMGYWKNVLDIPMLDISYDDLVVEPEENIRTMVSFCGLEWDARCLEFYKNKRDVNTPSYDQVRQPLYTKSSGRWRNYSVHLEELKKVLSL